MKKVLRKSFFNRDTKKVARDLLGKFLVRKISDKEVSAMITETEAYDGLKDKASHASKGRTRRTEVMFGHPGILYVYLCYGAHYMLNIVTREKDYPAAVLIRGAVTDSKNLSGPGKLTNFLHINQKLNTLPAQKKSGLWIEDRDIVILRKHIATTPRIGVDYAGPIWSKKPWRFKVKTK